MSILNRDVLTITESKYAKSKNKLLRRGFVVAHFRYQVIR